MNRTDQRSIDRRQALGALGAGATLLLPKGLTAQSGAKAPGVQASWVSHYTYVAEDLKKTRDWYVEVFGMQVGQQDARQCHLWYGDKGGDTLMIVRQAVSGETAPRIEKFAFAIENWNRKNVEAALTARSAKPRPDGNQGFWFSDPDGNEIGVFAAGHIKSPRTTATAAKLWKAVSANHMVILSEDFGRLRDWYAELLNLRITLNDNRNAFCWFGDSVWIPTAVRPGEKTSVALKSLDHVAYTIDKYVKNEVEAELTRRDLKPRLDTELSFNCVDINGFKTQVCDRQLVPVAEKRLR